MLKLDLTNAPVEVQQEDSALLGAIYRKAGGAKPGFWWIISICQTGRDAYVLSFDHNGEINGAQRYSLAYFERNDMRRVGRADIPTINVEWI